MRRWSKQRLNPLDYLKARGVEAAWIVFDPTVVKGVTESTIIRRYKHSHDGTMLFTYDGLNQVLLPLVTQAIFYKPDPIEPHLERGEAIRYRVGWLHLATSFPRDGVDLPAGRYPGVREQAAIAVQVEWVPEPTA